MPGKCSGERRDFDGATSYPNWCDGAAGTKWHVTEIPVSNSNPNPSAHTVYHSICFYSDSSNQSYEKTSQWLHPRTNYTNITIKLTGGFHKARSFSRLQVQRLGMIGSLETDTGNHIERCFFNIWTSWTWMWCVLANLSNEWWICLYVINC